MRFLALLTLCALCAASTAYSGRWYRSADIDGKPIPPTHSDLMLANVSHAAAATNMDVKTLRLDEAAASAEKLKNATITAAETQAISRSDAAEIHHAADKVQKAAKSGDQEAAIEQLEKLHEKVDTVVVEKKGPAVAENLEKHEESKDKPVLSTKEDIKILREAVAQVVESDPLVPPEKKKEATDFTVRMIQEGFENGNTTNLDLVNSVETVAANKNKTEAPSDRSMNDWDWRRCCRRRKWGNRDGFEGSQEGSEGSQEGSEGSQEGSEGSQEGSEYRRDGHEWEHRRDCGKWERDRCEQYERRRHSRQIYPYGGLYDPTFSYGFDYRQCLYTMPYEFCRTSLFGDYAFNYGFHHFYRHGRHRHHGRHGRRHG